MQIDVTDHVQRYRLALRFIWNSCIWVDPNLRVWDSVYSFRGLKLPLFKALVADPLGADGATMFGDGFQVVPIPEANGLSMLQVNVRLPDDLAGGIWEPVRGSFKAEDVDLTLLDMFDWSPLGYIDLRYYVVLITRFPSRPERVGHHALVDVMETKVLWARKEKEDEAGR
jgi:hypothetical protein